MIYIQQIKIENNIINLNSPIFLIAEVGINHNGSLNSAKRLIDISIEAKVDAIKFQTYNSDKLILKNIPKAEYQKTNNKDKESFYDLLKKYELSRQDFAKIKQYCMKKKIIFLSTPFDEDSVDLLEDLEIPAYKVGSGDMNNFPLLKKICMKKKPILLSTGMATLEDVRESVKYIKSFGNQKLAIFQCTTSYPTPLDKVNLNVIDVYKNEFKDNIIGFSDHSTGILASIGAAAKGVKIIEKHITLDKQMEGPDHKASMNPEELSDWVSSLRDLEKALGSSEKKPSTLETEIAEIARKSIVNIKNLKKGDIITEDHITIKRPGTGIPPKYYNKLIGKKVIRNIPKDTILNWKDIE